MRKERHDNGFTLAELLIVVAIIGALVAISIPIFSSQLEKAREATDAANIRSQYAEVMTTAITAESNVNQNHETYAPIELRQQKDEWQDESLKANLHGIFGRIEGDYPKAGGQAWVEYSSDNAYAILHYDGGSSGGGTSIENPENKMKDAADPWPDTTFSPSKGKVYSYNGKLYVVKNDYTGMNGMHAPDEFYSSDCISPTSTVLTRQNVDADGNMTSTVQRGDLFVDDDGSIYIMDFPDNVQSAPNPSDRFSNWVKVKTS